MTAAPLPLPHPPQLPRPQRLVGSVKRRRPSDVNRRHFAVGLTKRLLPVVALVLLSLVALWPEIERDEHSRLAAGVRAGGVGAWGGRALASPPPP